MLGFFLPDIFTPFFLVVETHLKKKALGRRNNIFDLNILLSILLLLLVCMCPLYCAFEIYFKNKAENRGAAFSR